MFCNAYTITAIVGNTYPISAMFYEAFYTVNVVLCNAYTITAIVGNTYTISAMFDNAFTQLMSCSETHTYSML